MTEEEKYDLKEFLAKSLSIFAEVHDGLVKIKLFLDDYVISEAKIGIGDDVDVWQAY